MISFAGYDDVIQRVYKYKQEHVFQYWDQLIDSEKKALLDELGIIDFDLLEKIFKLKENSVPEDFSPAPYIKLPEDERDPEFMKARDLGVQFIKEGKVAAFLVAGGQGSRLGFKGPKGKFPVGPVSGKTLFHFHAEKIRASEIKYGVKIPFLIMTSRDNHEETVDFFRENHFFGLTPALVHIFPQNMIPSLDLDGKLILSDKSTIFMNPDGHGGSLSALRSSGALKLLEDMGIEVISYFQVDNPLVKIIDPIFIGFHILNKADVSSKALMKAYHEEKTGVFVRFKNGKLGIIEYSDMPQEKIFAKDSEGGILYCAANPAIHLFDIKFVDKITGSSNVNLPYHVAKKKIEAFKDGQQCEITGLKFEKFVFDAIPMAEKTIILETKREEEFAPVKNASGADSVHTAQAMMNALFRRWLSNRGVKIPDGVDVIEISPFFALQETDIPEGTIVPAQEKVYLE
ncbi:MAG TPA: UTP--glucose-1-phosphate uridylyltransferase [Spirochaetota bacterium]|nr:UTP--glucose-1-phosphate uridylyltransferase [Spirochaetota bacterium]HOK91735.1 UTP--glucose-1-phosphate uridylyltransferase [Spirochaetota bacterium]HPP94858.1 UTP--glucose-1-phosphate uridylyltransferase [Spirochaetota bacterium]